ncbi:carbohydrate-binding protein [Massilia sp. H-1]|nr:carbohydrate-binding protein [Massilia sp. H-1]
MTYRVAITALSTGVIQLEQGGGAPVFGTVNVLNTGGWQNWNNVSHSVTLAA